MSGIGQLEEEAVEEAKVVTGEKPPRPMMVWITGTIVYAAIVVLAGLIFNGMDPEPSVFPPLLTALAGLFVATAINVRPGTGDEAGSDWNRFQTHAIVVAITSMVLSMGLVICALAFPGELIYRLALWGAVFAILIGASFLLATVWERLRADESLPEPEVVPPPEAAAGKETGQKSGSGSPKDISPKAIPEPKGSAEAKKKSGSAKKKSGKSDLRRAPQTALVAETLEKSKKPKKSGKKKSKSKDSKKKK